MTSGARLLHALLLPLLLLSLLFSLFILLLLLSGPAQPARVYDVRCVAAL
jgi:hypothetical protein